MSASGRCKEIGSIDLVQRAHDLGRTPCLIETEVHNDVRCLKPAVSAGEGRWVSRNNATAADRINVVNLRPTRRFGGNRAGPAVAELRGIAHHEPAAVASVGA